MGVFPEFFFFFPAFYFKKKAWIFINNEKKKTYPKQTKKNVTKIDQPEIKISKYILIIM